MKTLIAYATVTGVTAQCAKELAALIPGSITVNIAEESEIRMRDFDRIILGTYVRLGQIDDGMRFLAEMGKELFLEKELGIFVCSLDRERAEKYVIDGFGEEIARHAKIAGFGGRVVTDDPDHMPDRMTLRYADAFGGDTLDAEAISAFAKRMNEE